MKNSELDELLKSAKVPERPEGYWRDFPKRVSAKLHWQAKGSADHAIGRRRIFAFRPAWVAALAAVGVVMAFVVGTRQPRPAPDLPKSDQLAEARKCYQELAALFPHQVRAIRLDGRGPSLMLADQPEVPDSIPYYLKICGPGGCEGLVTFSGQEIQFNGELCEVLADDQGKVMLVAKDHVWRENDPEASLSIQATALAAVL